MAKTDINEVIVFPLRALEKNKIVCLWENKIVTLFFHPHYKTWGRFDKLRSGHCLWWWIYGETIFRIYENTNKPDFSWMSKNGIQIKHKECMLNLRKIKMFDIMKSNGQTNPTSNVLFKVRNLGNANQLFWSAK